MKQINSSGPDFLYSRAFPIVFFCIVFFSSSVSLAVASDFGDKGYFPYLIDKKGSQAKKNDQPLLDLSGLTWLGGDRFLTVHDAKNPKENDLNRVSILELPRSLDGLRVINPQVTFPEGPSNDLESAAGIPGTDNCLLVESGNNGQDFQRIFLARVFRSWVKIIGFVDWRSFTTIFNVEATAVVATKNGFVFLWAERNSNSQSTYIQWTNMTLEPFAFDGDNIREVKFTLPPDFVDTSGNPLYDRAIVGMDLDSEGNIYTVASFDPEDGQVANPDNGPFRSTVLKVGQFVDGEVVLDTTPTIIGVLDSLKTEAVVVREQNGNVEFYIGTDDENYGGIFRFLPSPDFP